MGGMEGKIVPDSGVGVGLGLGLAFGEGEGLAFTAPVATWSCVGGVDTLGEGLKAAEGLLCGRGAREAVAFGVWPKSTQAASRAKLATANPTRTRALATATSQEATPLLGPYPQPPTG